MEIRKQALDEEKKRREDLEKRLQEETSRRQKLIDREVKLREKQRAQVRESMGVWGSPWEGCFMIVAVPVFYKMSLISQSF